MPAALPYSKHTPGRTFVVAISLLGVVALTQVGVLGWAFIKRVQAPPPTPVLASLTGPGAPDAKPVDEKEKEPDALTTTDPFDDGKSTSLDNSSEPIMPPAKPQPVQMARLQLAPDSRLNEMIQQGRALRERGDTNNALLRFREAYAADPKNPEAIYEIAVTLEKMGLPDKAAENWKRVYDMGETAGVYYSAAEAKMREAVMSTRVTIQQPNGEEASVQSGGGTAATATFGVGAVESVEVRDPKALRHLVLRVPIQLRLKTKINVKDLVIQVIFYDLLDGKPIRTNANVSNHWSTAPVDWREDESEVLEVDYMQPPLDAREPKREDRKYYGYIVRVYYKDDLQATSAEPSVLGQRFPASQTLEKDSPQ